MTAVILDLLQTSCMNSEQLSCQTEISVCVCVQGGVLSDQVRGECDRKHKDQVYDRRCPVERNSEGNTHAQTCTMYYMLCIVFT